MEARSRSRPPSLQPIWTEQYDMGDYRKAAFRTHRSPAVSPSPRSPKTLPDHMHPSTPIYDNTMRQHERTLEDRLDARGMPEDQTSSQPLSPIAEQSVVSRLEKVSVNSPGLPRTPVAPPPTPAYPMDARRQTISSQARSMLLSGVPQMQASSLGTTMDRRQSAPADVIAHHREAVHLLFREQLQAWGHVHFGNAMNADVFVAAAAMRRGSESSVSGEELEKKSPAGQITIRARVRPRDIGRKPFLITRNFDLEELRAMVPGPQQHPPEARRSSVDLTARTPTTGSHQRSASARYKLRSSDRALRSPGHHGAGRSVVHGTKEMPIRK